MSDSAVLYRGSISPDEAVDRLRARVGIVTATHETVGLGDAAGRIIAGDLIAPTNLPASNNAAVDGYAVDAAFLARQPDHAFQVIGRAAAGHPFGGAVPSGAAVRIFTGAVMPAGTDAVAMHEFCRPSKDSAHVQIDSKLTPGSNNRPAGENLRQGEVIIAAGTRLDAADTGIAAAAGFAQLTLFRRPVVGLLSMGDELVEAGGDIHPGQLHDSNRPMLAEMLRADGFLVRDFAIIPDNRDALSDVFRVALSTCDAVISSGGASDGDEDHTQAAMDAVTAEKLFWRLAIKPGRPMSAAILDGVPLMCLPGNPVAAFVCTKLLILPLLTVLAGGIMTAPLKFSLNAGFSHKKAAGRAEYLRAIIADGAEGQEIQLHGRKGAGVISSLTGADGLVEIPLDNVGVTPGMRLNFLPFADRSL